ncbi:MAG: nucleotidyltransferase family protein [Oscillospiraceae bacterium]|nr:nucleotidyltransferase family protein [Oscillospiraceae bacterium]
MTAAEQQLIGCLRAFCRNEPADRVSGVQPEELHRLAAVHKLVPVVYETLSGEPEAFGEARLRWKQEATLSVALQAKRTEAALRLCAALNAVDVPYALVKGLICRSLYPHPDHRASADEDLFVLPEHRAACEAVLEAQGLVCAEPGETESNWSCAESGLAIELHLQLFSEEYEAERRMNAYFREAAARCEFETVSGVPVRTLAPQDHFLLLVCHALKHFHYSGFGLRTLSDIGLFATRYGSRFDWTEVRRMLDAVGGMVFCDHVLHICQTQFVYDSAAAGYIPEIAGSDEALLTDVLDAGVYGQSTMSRKHSANIVLQNLKHAEPGSGRGGVLRALFPPRAALVSRYPALKKAPVLLPAVWLARIGTYGADMLRGKLPRASAAESIELGKRRTELMRQYGVFEESQTEDR